MWNNNKKMQLTITHNQHGKQQRVKRKNKEYEERNTDKKRQKNTKKKQEERDKHREIYKAAHGRKRSGRESDRWRRRKKKGRRDGILCGDATAAEGTVPPCCH